MTQASYWIDGHEVDAATGLTILEASHQLGIEIPTLCHEPELEPTAQCRMCLVEIEGVRQPLPACATRAEPGMQVRTLTESIRRSRQTTLQLLLARHPALCPARSRGMSCRLCDYAEKYGVSQACFSHGPESAEVRQNGFMGMDTAACIRCEKCVRVCAEIQGVDALTMIHRGSRMELSPGRGATLADTDCEMCGNCVDVCPTGAIHGSHVARLNDATKVPTTCGFCGVGCQLELNVLDDRVVGVTTTAGNPVNGRWLCVKGRFGYDFIHHPERLTRPLIRRNGQLEPTSWEEALGFVATRLKDIKSTHGPDALGFMSSSRATNEENYLMAKLARAVIGTNSVDQCART